MSHLEEKLQKFQGAVESQAEAKAKKIREHADYDMEKKLEEYEEELKTGIEHEVKEEKDFLMLDEIKNLSRFDAAQRERYYKHRLSLETALFEEVAEKLKARQDTQEYKTWFKDSLIEIEKQGFLGAPIVYVNKKDLGLEKDIKDVLGAECQVKEDRHILLGGFLYENDDKHYTIDYTMDTVLQDANRWFHKTVKLPD